MQRSSEHPILFKLGLILLAVNYPLGYGSLWVCGIMFVKTKSIIWLSVGGGLYGLSWIMLAVGFLLAGQKGLQKLHFFIRRTRHRVNFLHLKDKDEKNTDTTGTGI